MSDWVCIDFGTCNSAAAILVDGVPKLVSLSNKTYFPTVACVISKDNIVVCEGAEPFKQNYPDRYLQEFKLHINEPLDCYGVDYRSVVGAILRHIKSTAEIENNGKPIDGVVLTIPALYTENDSRKAVMRQAAMDAGFREVEFLREPIAACMHYACVTGCKESGLSLVYDLGGGTFDPALLDIAETGEVKFVGGDNGVKCGGQFFDAAIYKCAAEEAKRAGKPLERSSRPVDYAACRLLKENLSVAEKSTTLLSNGMPFTMSRAQFETLIAGKLQLTLEACDAVLSTARKTWRNVSRVLLVGGSTAIPLVSRMLQEHLVSSQASKNVQIVRSQTCAEGIYDHNYAVCLGGITRKAAKKPGGRPEYHPTGQLSCSKGNYTLHEGDNLIGRSSDCDFTVAGDPSMSRLHFKIVVRRGEDGRFEYHLISLSESKATIVNGILALSRDFGENEYGLADGDRIFAGRTQFVFRRGVSEDVKGK